MHGDDLVELLLGHLAHRRVAGDARVVHHDVETAEVFDRRGDQRVDLVGLGHIAPHSQGGIAPELLACGFCRGEVEIAEHHRGTLGDEASAIA